ncbi:MAG: DUF4838 domain-containing protein [Victivallales bacterium]|nr:DUF4838 domain-containing protein [Victivallales bacterium]
MENRTPLLTFAAEEMQRFLSQATCKNIPIVTRPSQGVTSMVLGDCALARAAGLDVSKLASEGFYIKRIGEDIYLLGLDAPRADPKANPWGMWLHRGSLNAVYDFLERFVGIRFYFAGKYGTIVPSVSKLELPDEIDIMDRPDLIGRTNYSGPKSKWYEKDRIYLGSIEGKNLNLLRHRYSDGHIPFGHGLFYLDLIVRFGNSHPEYFALTKDGRRYKEADHVHPGQICFSSGVVEEIYQDAKAFLTGKPASSRRLSTPNWNPNFGYGEFVSVMPVDWLYWCCCERCAKIAPGERAYQNDAKAAQAISNHVWQYTADIARRLKAEHVDGIVTQMAYGPLKRLPECAMPENVSVQLALNGMGAPAKWEEDAKLLQQWTNKFKGKVSIWTYPGKHMSKAEMKGIPAMMHRETGKYLQYVKDYVYGVFLESETDYEIFNYLNYYTFGKLAWDMDTDLDALLEEHYKLMFGAGAQEMKLFFNELEDIWCKQITGRIVDTAYGPQMKLPSEFQLWNNILPQKKIQELNAHIDKAKLAASGDNGAIERLDFMRREMLGPIMARMEQFNKNRQMLDSWAFNVPGNVGLRPYNGDTCQVTTKVSVVDKPECLELNFDCEEPLMGQLKVDCTTKDKIGVFMDSCVEVLLNPSGDRKRYYHIGVNAKGIVADSAWQKGGNPDYSWNAMAKVLVKNTEKGYNVNISIPKNALGEIKPEGFPVNFARHRAATGEAAKQITEDNYQWSPVPGRSFHDIDQWGMMNLKPVNSSNLLKDADFDSGRLWLPTHVGEWLVWSSDYSSLKESNVLDDKVFMTGNRALHLTNKKGQNIAASQKLQGLKPNSKYKLSYFLRTRGLAQGLGAGAFLKLGAKQFAFPNVRITGDADWHQRTFDFTTPAELPSETECILSLWIWTAEGQAWFDNVSVTEMK